MSSSSSNRSSNSNKIIITPCTSLIPTIQPQWKRTIVTTTTTTKASEDGKKKGTPFLKPALNSSKTNSSNDQNHKNDEGIDSDCQVCQECASNYSCPKCFMAYCSLSCYQQHSASCTEQFYQRHVNQELDLERKDKSNLGHEEKNGILQILNRVHQQQHQPQDDEREEEQQYTNSLLNTDDTDDDADDADSEVVHDLELEQLHEALLVMNQQNHDNEGPFSLDHVLTPELQAAFERDIKSGRFHDHTMMQQLMTPWIPWWVNESSLLSSPSSPLQSISELQEHDTTNLESLNDAEKYDGPSLDDRMLSLPSFSTLSSKPASSCLPFHAISLIRAIASTLRLYNHQHKCLEAAESLVETCPILQSSSSSSTAAAAADVVSYDSLENVLLQETGPWMDTILILKCPRHVIHILLDGMDIFQAAINEVSSSLSSKEEKQHWKRLRKKMEFFASWSRSVVMTTTTTKRIPFTSSSSSSTSSSTCCLFEQLAHDMERWLHEWNLCHEWQSLKLPTTSK